MNKTKLSALLIALLSVTTLAGCDKPVSSSNSSSADTSSASSTSSTSSASSASASTSANTSSGQQTVELTSIALNKTETSILNGSSETLSVTFNPNNASDKEVVWSSDDASIASVNNGVVTAKKVGKTNIKVTAKNKTSVYATCQVTVVDNVVLSNVAAKDEFVKFSEHKNKDSQSEDGFYDHDQVYKVGDDNNFNIKPSLTVLDGNTYLPVSASRWTYDYTITAKLDGEPVGSDYFSVVDARECDIKFTDAAVGKTFTVSVVPGGISQSRVESLTRSITVEVVDGYNVYNAKELAYFDTREQNSTVDTPTMEDDSPWQCKWNEFKETNGLDVNKHPAALIFHKDIEVTVDDLPENFFYTKQQAQALNDPKAEGSLIDYGFLYERTIPGDITIDGNYFGLDFSNIPLIKRERAKTTDEGEVVSHSAAFKAIDGGNICFRNINMNGNAGKSEDTTLGGGLIFAKGAGSKTFKSYNIIAANFYITFFGEKPSPYGGGNFTQFELDKVKCYYNYNSFMYNWGSTITVSNSLFDTCGGPVIIQDHAGTDDYEAFNGMQVVGFAPTTNFVDCSITNYVSGSEAWFQQFNATSVTPLIKSLSDLFYATGLTKSFVTDKNHEGKLYQALAAAGEASFFNFIVLNKSGEAEGMTNVPNCGTVNIIESNKTTTFNYRQPNNDSVAQAYVAYQTAATDEDQAAAQQAIVAAMLSKGYTFEPDYSDLFAKVQAYLEELCTPHGAIRYVNGLGGPVFDFGGNYDLLTYNDKVGSYLLSTKTSARYEPTVEELAGLPNYTTLYYQGMALVLALTPYAA